MVEIEQKTFFHGSLEYIFDAERNISLHSATQEHRGERAVAGVTKGLIEKGQEVEWEAFHLGIKQRLRIRVTHMEKPSYFRDEMISGAFKSFSHEHHFKRIGEGLTEKRDVMRFEAPLGLFGRLAEILFLRRYMEVFLRKKNLELKKLIEKEDPPGPPLLVA
jgi:ligand-binding SRPBCC domain-containing protein